MMVVREGVDLGTPVTVGVAMDRAANIAYVHPIPSLLPPIPRGVLSPNFCPYHTLWVPLLHPPQAREPDLAHQLSLCSSSRTGPTSKWLEDYTAGVGSEP